MFKTKRDVDRHVTHILNKIREEKERNARGYQFAKLYYDVGDYPSSKRYVQAFLSIRETVPQAHKLLGQVYDALKEKTKAIDSYKRSLDLDPDQNDLVLKVCELYGDPDVKASSETVQYWIDRAEKHFPEDRTLFKLKERLIDVEGTGDKEELENLISQQLLKNPGDVQLHIKLLRLYMQSREVERAYEHVLKTECTLAFVTSVDWYECLSEVYLVYQDQLSCAGDVTFYTYKLFALSTLAFLKLRSEERDLMAAVKVIHQLDQDLLECSGIQKQTADWTTFLTEMKGQLVYLIALLLLKRASKGQMQWKDATTFSSMCFLLSDALPAVDLKVGWFRQVPKDRRRFYERVQMLGYDRLSQGGHMIHELKKDEPGWATKLRQRLWTSQGRDGLYNVLFTGTEMKRKKATSFLLQDSLLANTNFQVPALSQLIKYDSVAFTLHADSLNHLVWLALRYFKDDIQQDYEQFFQCQLYPSLKYNSSDLSSGDPSSLSQLDIQVFLYACVKWTSLDLREKKRSLHSTADKPSLLPVCLTPSLCNRGQADWWNAVYKMEAKSGNSKLSQLWGVVTRGLETVRLVSPHTLSLSMVVLLARNLDARVREMESVEADVVTPKLTALQTRTAFYWSQASDMLDRIDRNLSVKLPKEMLFPDNSGSSLAQIKELREQVRFAMALISMREERFEDALKGFEGLCLPEASYYTGLIYRQMAENLNSNGNSANDTQISLLTRAKDSLYQALDRLESDKNEELKSHVKQELDDVVCKLISLESGGSLVDSILSANSPNYSTAESEADDGEEAVGKQPSMRTPILTTPSRSQRISPTRIDVQLRALETTNSALSARLNTLEETVRSNVKHIQELFSQLHEARDENRGLRGEIQMLAFQGLSNMSGMATVPRPAVPQAFPATPQTRGLLNTMNTSFGTGLPYDYGAPAGIPPHMSQYGYPVTGGSPRPSSAFGPQNYEEDLSNVDGEYYDPDIDYVSDQNLVQEWPFGHKAVAEGKSTITYSPQHQNVAAQGVAQGVAANPANTGMFAHALRGPALQYGNFQQPQVSLPMPGPGFFSQPSSADQSSTVQTQSGLFQSPGTMGVNMTPKTGITPTMGQAKTVPPAQPLTANKPASSIMPPNAVASQSTESKPKLITGSVGVPTPVKEGGAQPIAPGAQPTAGAHLTPNTGGVLSSPGPPSPGSAAATLSQLAAKHQESGQSLAPQTVNVPSSTPQKTVFKGFTFSSTPKVADKPKTEASQPGTAAGTAAPKPFSGFSLTVPSVKPAVSQPQVTPSPFLLAAQSAGDSSTAPGVFGISPSRRHNMSTGSDDHADEYEPNVDFKPVVPLPDLVEVKTGEEEEEQMFCERAKLFRYDPESKQWKERGIGEMKILKHKQTEVVRILMRREQVLKLCANHRLSKEMKLTPMASSDKAWVWEAMDFSEEEMKYEKLACKFKNADIASKFKEAFESSQKEQTDSAEEKVEAKPKPEEKDISAKPDLSAMFKPKAGSWTCGGCIVQNGGDLLECPCCKALKPGVKKEDVKSSTTASSTGSIGAGGGFTFGAPAVAAGSTAGGVAFGAPAGSSSVKPDLSAMFKPKAGSWTCGGCYVQNGGDLLECPCCKALKPGVKKEDVKSSTTESTSGSIGAGGGFTFGGPAVPAGSTAGIFGAATGSSSTGGFKFGSTAVTTASSSPFVAPASTSTATKSLFGASTAPTSEGFLFGAPTSTSATPSQTAASSSTTASSESSFMFGGQSTVTSKPSATTVTTASSVAPFNLPEPCKPTSGFTFGGGAGTAPSQSASVPVSESLLAKVLSEESPAAPPSFTFTPSKPMFGATPATEPKTDATKTAFGAGASLGQPGEFSFSMTPSNGLANKSAFGSSAFTFSMSTTPSKTAASPAKSPGITSPGINEDGYYVTKEEDDSHIHFEPVIALPDKVEVKTGEEGEEVLFVHRAKLYRFINKEWKERGLGDMKILYNKETNKTRLLMRRAQILKMCCNHNISPDIKFTPMPNSKGCAVVWFAMDFSEDEPKSEQFSIKFKSQEIVDKFLTGVEEARKRCAGEVESIGATSTASTTTAAVTDDDVMFVKEETATPEQIKKAQDLMLPDSFYLYLKKPACPGCRGCDDRMPDWDVPVPVMVTEAAKQLEKVPFEEEEEEDDDEDTEDDDEEEEEEEDNDEDEEETDEYDSETGDVETDDKPSIFGTGGSQPSFGDLKSSTGSSSFVFGGASAAFSFSDLAKTADPNAFKSEENKPFSWQGAGKKLFGAGAAAGEEGEGDDVEQSEDPHFEPVIALPDLVDVKTGEEDETVEYAQRAKLFRFDNDVNQWKEKGLGEMKILKHKQSCRYRLLLRREQVHKLACNHMLTLDLNMTPMETSEVAWCWTAQDYSESEGKLEKLAIKFKTIELAEAFKKKFDECQENLRKDSAGNEEDEPRSSLMGELLTDETDN